VIRCSFCLKNKEEVKKLIVGDQVAICDSCVIMCSDLLIDETEEAQDIKKNSLYPSDIKDYLDQYVIGQEQAKMILSVAVSNHYKRINNTVESISVQKSNILVLGPTGSGKTLLAKTVATYLDVPFVVADATSLTEAGYVGDDVESMISRLLAAANGDIEAAQRGIIFIDEVDKIARKSESQNITRDVSGEGVQQALLKIVEGTKCRIPQQGRRKNPNSDMLEIDTTNILFIAGGAFVGLENIISRRIDHNSIGFGSSIKNTAHTEHYLKHIIPDDLMAFGMIPEFTGRFANIVSISELTRSQLVEVLTKVKNNYIDQYKYLLSIDNIDLTFDEDVYDIIAENCLKLKTGARGLHSEIERILLHVMYNTKYLQNKKINITHDHVSTPEQILLDYMDHQ